MKKEIRDKIIKAKKQEQILIDAINYNYFDSKKCDRATEELKEVRKIIFKLQMEALKDDRR